MKLKFSRQIFLKNAQISNFMKIRPVGAELFNADRQTDMTKLIVISRNFANAPRNQSVNILYEIVAVCSEIHTKHINTLCGQNVEFVNVKPGGT
jgi:proteasome assembly chaperone (PAC2) family protein